MNYPGNTLNITLYSPLKLKNGAELKTVSMREPLVRDRIEFAKDRGTDEEKTLRILSSLCDLNEEDLLMMTSADHSQLTDAFNDFLLPPAQRAKRQ